MAITYVNDLRLSEMGTGDNSGTWGTVTNTNLELIGEALGYGTEAITTNADTHASTIEDGSTDPVRAMYVKYTGTLDSACTITIGPNTVNKFYYIENATSGSQDIIISQGSGANVTIPAGDVKAVYLDGAGSGAAVTDAFASLNVGSFTSEGASTITTADNTVQLTLISTDADASVGPQLELYRNSGSPADNDVLGFLTFKGRNDNSQDVVYAGLQSYILDASDGTEDGYLVIDTMVAGTARERISFDSAATVFNEEGIDLDFRIETDAQPSAFVLDAADDTITTTNQVVTITHGGNGKQLELVSTDADANSGPQLDLYRNSASPADDDYTGRIKFISRNDNSQDFTAVDFLTRTIDVSDGSEDATLFINTMTGGSTYNRINITPTEVVLNEESRDLDFRVESNGNANMLFVDGGNDHVNIGTSTDLGGVFNVSGATSSQFHSTDRHLMSLVSTEAGASDGPRLILQRDSSSPADNDQLGIIEFYGENDADEAVEYARINASILDASDGTEDGAFAINTRIAGANVNRLYMPPTETVFNENSSDIDFRVESNGRANMFVIDGGVDQIGVGMTPDQSWGSNSVGINFGIADADAGWLGWQEISGGDNFHMMWNVYHDNTNFRYASNNPAGKYTQNAGSHTFSHAANGSADAVISFIENLRMNSTGAVFNEGSADLDFRVEGDNNSHALFVDASADLVAIKSNGGAQNGVTAQSLSVRGDSAGNTTPVMMISDSDSNVEADSEILHLAFTDDSAFATAIYARFNDQGGAQGSISGEGGGSVAFNTSSDERLKENIVDTESKWDVVKSLQVRDYKWKKSDKVETGFIAQELNEKWSNPVLVGGDDETRSPWSVDYGRLTPLLTKALQEAMKKIEELETKVAALEG